MKTLCPSEVTNLHLRRANRYHVSAPVSFWWSRSGGPIQSGAGITGDISHCGLLVETSECPPTGVPIQLTVLLPKVGGNGYGMKLHGEGIVVRVETDEMVVDQRTERFAASVQFFPEQSDELDQPRCGDEKKLGTTHRN